MDWYRRLYLGKNIKEKRNKLISMIEKNAGTRRLHSIYLITLASNEKDLFDIINADYLLQSRLHGHVPMIVGMTDDYDEAVEIVSSIILDNYRLNQNFDIYSYLKNRITSDSEIFYHYPMEQLKPRFHFFKRLDRTIDRGKE